MANEVSQARVGSGGPKGPTTARPAHKSPPVSILARAVALDRQDRADRAEAEAARARPSTTITTTTFLGVNRTPGLFFRGA